MSETPKTEYAPEAFWQIERAISDLRRGVPVVLYEGEGEGILCLAAENYASSLQSTMEQLVGERPYLLVTSRRAEQMGINPGTDGKNIRLILERPLDDAMLARIIMPGETEPAKQLKEEASSQLDDTANTLCKLAGLLPALLVFPLRGMKGIASWARERHLLAIERELVLAYRQSSTLLRRISNAQVPLKEAEKAEIYAFRPMNGGPEHLAIVIGEPVKKDAPLVRVHSSCITGDLLGSLRCDCGDQLHKALELIAKEGDGVLIYLNQEGRGIGIANKLRAYVLQDTGVDTYEANHALGFEDDERDFGIASEILASLGIRAVSLITNNPDKVRVLKDAGLAVKRQVPVVIPANPHSQRYLEAKAARRGHKL